MVNSEFAECEEINRRDRAEGGNIIDLSSCSAFRGRREEPQALADPILLDRDPVLDIARSVHNALRDFLKSMRSREPVQAGFLVAEVKALETGDLLKLLNQAVLKLEGLFEANSHASLSMVETANKAQAIKGGIAEFYSVLREFSPAGRLQNTASGRVAAAALKLQSGLADFIETLNRMALQKYYSRATAQDPSGLAS